MLYPTLIKVCFSKYKFCIVTFSYNTSYFLYLWENHIVYATTENMVTNTLGQEYFSNLCILMFNKDIEVNLDSVVDVFADRNQRRMQFKNVFKEKV